MSATKNFYFNEINKGFEDTNEEQALAQFIADFEADKEAIQESDVSTFYYIK